MTISLLNTLHSTQLKDLAKYFLAAGKQIADEEAASVESSEPAIAPVVMIAQPLADSFFDKLIARVNELEQDQEAKAVAVAAVSTTPVGPLTQPGA